jgi:6-pyruvoyltetrahydropterin/6-carboxytetrahydropterin synthase
MGSYELRSEVSFSAGHRLLGYDGKCISPHGHTYRVELVAEGDHVDALGMLMDFSDLQNVASRWIRQHWDHAFLVNSDDDEMLAALKMIRASRSYSFNACNPTAENMARVLYGAVRADCGGLLRSVTVWETQDQAATYRKDDTA